MLGDDVVGRLLMTLLRGFHWCDASLQNCSTGRGSTAVTPTQSMMMAYVARGLLRPSDLARRLGVTRHAVHAAIRQLRELGLNHLVEDPHNRATKIIALTPVGTKMRADAHKAGHRRRIGAPLRLGLAAADGGFPRFGLGPGANPIGVIDASPRGHAWNCPSKEGK